MFQDLFLRARSIILTRKELYTVHETNPSVYLIDKGNNGQKKRRRQILRNVTRRMERFSIKSAYMSS
jgi:hypothetical protein